MLTPPVSSNASPENTLGWIMSSPFDIKTDLVSGRNHLKGVTVKSDKFITMINDLLSIDLNHRGVLLKFINKNL